MKSPTMASLMQTKVRHALGVMLAISAIFAVVISTISMPGDRATAQVADADAEVSKRAEAWWDSLTAQERTNAFWGKAFDNDTTETGTQLPAQASIGYDSLPATDANGSLPGELSFVPGPQGFISQEYVKEVVDGNSDTSASFTGDIYAVGEEASDLDQAIRGFQSVELWWDHLTCTEARMAVGEDNDDLLLDADTATGNQPEESAVCDANLNEAGDTIDPAAKAYSDVKSMADAVGQAILGLSSAGSASSADDARAKRWWDSLNDEERANALYGDAVSIDTTPERPLSGDTVAATRLYLVTRKYDEITAGISYPATQDPLPAKTFTLNEASAKLATGVKELVNDRWQWIYHMGGTNDDNKAELVYWWDSIDTAQRRIAVGIDNEPTPSTNPADYGVKWNALNPDTDANTPGHQGSADGKAREAKVFKHGQAILGQTVLPQVGAWWGTLSADQMVYVVYGNPPMRTAYDHDNDNATDPVTTVTAADKAVFQKPYAELDDDDGIRVAENTTALNTHLPAYVATMLGRNNLAVDTPTAGPDGDDTDEEPDYHYYSAKAIVDAIANEIFDAPTGQPTADSSFEHSDIADDNDFDWPYHAENGPANVSDWWETLDCRTMRLAVGQDNQYLDPAVLANPDATPPVAAKDAETSKYCAHFPGHDDNAENDLSETAQKRVVVVGKALLGLTAESNGLHAGRPSFNVAVTGIPTITGTARVGSMLTANTGAIADGDGVGAFSYQWIRDGADISGATGSTYTLTAADANAMISVRVSFTDGERYPESTTSVGTSVVAGSLGRISKIEPAIRDIKLSGGNTVALSVNVYGVQGDIDNSLGGTYSWSVNGTSIEGSGSRAFPTPPRPRPAPTM